MKITFETTFAKLGKQSVTDYCRQLLQDGENPNSRVEVFRKGKIVPDLIVNNIGEAAKITIKENSAIGPVFVKYKPLPEALKGGERVSG